MKRNTFVDPFNGARGIYHFSSSHQETRRIFRSDKDFIFGVNTLALLLPGSRVKIIAYCLMDNHIHLLLCGTYKDCLEYYDKVTLRIAQMLGKTYGISGVFRRDDLDVVAVTSESQLKSEICYIHRNPYKARMASPETYRWSSADVYFSNRIQHGSKVSGLGAAEIKRLFRTHSKVPGTYEFEDGRILNSSFVFYKSTVEKFSGSVEYFDLLRRHSLEAEVEEAHGIHESVVFSDSELTERIKAICINEFHRESISMLDRKELLRMARLISYRYGAGRAQLARILGVGKDVLERIL